MNDRQTYDAMSIIGLSLRDYMRGGTLLSMSIRKREREKEEEREGERWRGDLGG